jgi:hypothetical protein
MIDAKRPSVAIDSRTRKYTFSDLKAFSALRHTATPVRTHRAAMPSSKAIAGKGSLLVAPAMATSGLSIVITMQKSSSHPLTPYNSEKSTESVIGGIGTVGTFAEMVDVKGDE